MKYRAMSILIIMISIKDIHAMHQLTRKITQTIRPKMQTQQRATGAQALCHIMNAWEKLAQDMQKKQAEQEAQKKEEHLLRTTHPQSYQEGFVAGEWDESCKEFPRAMRKGFICAAVPLGTAAVFFTSLTRLLS